MRCSLQSAVARARAGNEKLRSRVQHTGFGRQLMNRAESIAAAHGYYRMAVISGIGARAYYRKLGYAVKPGLGGFMIKRVPLRVVLKACVPRCAVIVNHAPVAAGSLVSFFSLLLAIAFHQYSVHPFFHCAVNMIAGVAAIFVLCALKNITTFDQRRNEKI